MQFINLFIICFISVMGVTSAHAGEPDLDFYTHKIQPIFDNRCLACHSCFNAPCQLNLQNYDGFLRGANKLNVYDGTRTKAVEPSRIWVDAKTTAEWRKKAFFTVHTSEKPDENLFFRMINLRADRSDLSVTKQVHESEVCAANMKEYELLQKGSPELGMSYGLPPLTQDQLKTLQGWIEKGAPGPSREEQRKHDQVSTTTAKQIRQWESFLNQTDLKQQLISRYLYEHLFLAHIYFPQNKSEFFRLVRSRAACESGVDEIATRRPNDDPGTKKFFYCLSKFPGTMVMKTHIPYEWNEAKLARYKKVFSEGSWKVESLPSYAPGVAENPFIAFKDIPVKARYQFLLDDAQYEVSTFIKGPVCNGSMAVNSIQEQFYVFFLQPQSDNMVISPEYAEKAKDMLVLPGMWGSDVELLKTPLLMKKIVDHREAYRKLRVQELLKIRPKGYSLSDIWDGDGKNPNALLTVFRHDQNAVVLKGAVGDLSKTAFVLDYPLLERLVYNLVVNFDVFGNVSHQLMTRVYMDMIRMEAEELFLMFLPPEQRIIYRRQWYSGLLAGAKMSYIFPTVGSIEPTAVRYTDSQKTKKQFVEKVLFYRFNEQVRGSLDLLNWKNIEPPRRMMKNIVLDPYDAELRTVASIPAESKTPFARFFPDVAYITIQSAKGARVYTLIHNKEHENISWITGESLRMSPEEDTLTFKEGFWASYPNMLFVVTDNSLKDFVQKIAAIKSDKDYQALVDIYGVRRQNKNFWQSYDALNAFYKEHAPEDFGYLDLTRYDL